MGWDAATIASAMGIAASSSAGLMAFVNTGAMTKRLHPARSGQLGVEAAFLANEGVVGPSDILENERGFLHAFSPNPKPEILSAGLGQEWKGRQMMLKLSPVHMCVQAFVYAINKARSKGTHAWDAENIDAVTISGGPNALRPSHMIRLPESLVSAQYSVPFSIAAALTTDLRDPMQMNDNLVSDPLTRHISEQMIFEVSDKDAHALSGSIEITCHGRKVTIDAGDCPGLPGNKGYAEATIDKYERVIQSLNIVTEGKMLRSKIEGIVKLEDVSELMQAMVKAGKQATSNIV
jgi:2-methylcitrate dehydratase PrpD